MGHARARTALEKRNAVIFGAYLQPIRKSMQKPIEGLSAPTYLQPIGFYAET